MSLESFFSQSRSTLVGLGIKHRCACDKFRRPEELYLCSEPGCVRFVCNDCSLLTHDSFYCPGCLNSYFSSVAFSNKSRCPQCVVCPICPQPLTIVQANGSHFFRCNNCEWKSDDAQITASSPTELLELITDEEEVHDATFTQALAHHQESIRKRAAEENGDEEPLEMESEDSLVIQKAVTELDIALQAKLDALALPKEDANNEWIQRSDHTCTAAGAMYTSQTPALYQLLNHAREGRDATFANLRPRRMELLSKKGHRCPDCETYVIKPKAGANKVDFDVFSCAILAIPALTVSTPMPPLSPGKSSDLWLYFSNPSTVPMTVQIAQHTSDDSTADVVVANSVVMMNSFDAAKAQNEMQYPDESTDQDAVVFRRLHKHALLMKVTPKADITKEQDAIFYLQISLRVPSKSDASVTGFEEFDTVTKFYLGRATGKVLRAKIVEEEEEDDLVVEEMNMDEWNFTRRATRSRTLSRAPPPPPPPPPR